MINYRGYVITEEFQGIGMPAAFRVARTTASGNVLDKLYGTHQTQEQAQQEIDALQDGKAAADSWKEAPPERREMIQRCRAALGLPLFA